MDQTNQDIYSSEYAENIAARILSQQDVALQRNSENQARIQEGLRKLELMQKKKIKRIASTGPVTKML